MADDTKAPEPEKLPEAPTHDAAPAREGIPRRRFLNDSWKVLGLALVVEAGWTSYSILNPPQTGGFGGVIDAGPVSDYIKEGTVKYFLDGRFWVTQYKGGLRALYQKCPHLGCRVPWNEAAQEFQCPCHGSVYNLIGEYESGPAPRGMDRFDISVSNGRVLVDTSAVILGPPQGVLTGPSGTPGTATAPSPTAPTGASS